jgi:excisionase family DNA binding protein
MARAERHRHSTTAPSLLDLEQQEDGPTLGISAVSTVLGLSEPTVRELLEHGDIRSVRHGRNWKVLWRSLRVYLYRSGALPLRAEERRPLVPSTLKGVESGPGPARV